jgi:hypothetical protein
MKPFSLRIFNYRFWMKAALFLCAVIVVHGLVKILTMYIASGLGIIHVSRDFWMQLFSIQMIPTIAAYGLLAGIAYFQFIKVGKIMNRMHRKDMETAQSSATVETMQKMTAYMAEYITLHNNQILAWASKKKEKGESVPHAVEISSARISEAMRALSEISFVMPYDREQTDPGRYMDILKNRLSGYQTEGKEAV